MKYNELLKFTQIVKRNQDVYSQIVTILTELKNVYSYLVTAKYDNDNSIIEWKIQYLVSKTDAYNTICAADAIEDIVNSVIDSMKSSKKKTITFRQPPLELMLELYSPFLLSLARSTHSHWNNIFIEDAYQIANLCLIKLYRQRYYIHKKLLTKTYTNEILQYLRQYFNEPKCISLETTIHNDDNEVYLKDTIVDVSLENEKEEAERLLVITQLYDNIKTIALEIMSERQFDQLKRDYANKHTTSTSRKNLQVLKNHLKDSGITYETLLCYVLSK